MWKPQASLQVLKMTYAIQMLKEAYLDDAGEKVHGTVRKVPLHVINDGDTGIRGAVYAALTSSL